METIELSCSLLKQNKTKKMILVKLVTDEENIKIKLNHNCIHTCTHATQTPGGSTENRIITLLSLL